MFIIGVWQYSIMEMTIDDSEVIFKKGIAYKKKNSEPFTGKVELSYKNGQKKLEAHFKKGLQDGVTVEWYKNGKKKKEVEYKGNKLNGLSISWYENGEVESRIDGNVDPSSPKNW